MKIRKHFFFKGKSFNWIRIKICECDNVFFLFWKVCREETVDESSDKKGEKKYTKKNEQKLRKK